jgi:hypothetical protein
MEGGTTKANRFVSRGGHGGAANTARIQDPTCCAADKFIARIQRRQTGLFYAADTAEQRTQRESKIRPAVLLTNFSQEYKEGKPVCFTRRIRRSSEHNANSVPTCCTIHKFFAVI